MARYTRRYHVVALQIPIVYNKHRQDDLTKTFVDPNGMLYTLKKNEENLKHLIEHFFQHTPAHEGLNPYAPHPLVRPLVLRACQGETVEIHFENQLQRRASIHLQSDGYDVQTSDGAAVGLNRDSTVAPGGETVYTWQVDREGVFLFHDAANLSGEEDGTNVHGLFGALIVEPAGATWTDPETGDLLSDGLYADVHPQGAKSYREFTIFFHDELEAKTVAEVLHEAGIPHPPHNHDAPPAVEPPHGGNGHNGGHGNHAQNPHVMPISYRSEPMHGRMDNSFDPVTGEVFDPRDPNANRGYVPTRIVGEEQHHSSWAFGDPATPILRSYPHDPAKIHLIHAGVKETHVYHLHVYQWYAVPENPKSPLIDAISISPQTCLTFEPLYGGGSRQGAIGDVIWHCHLYPHFHHGMWGMWRVHDVLEEGFWRDADGNPLLEDAKPVLRRYPDRTPIAPLKPLPDRQPPPIPTQERPGFPLFIPGKYGEKSPPPPLSERRVKMEMPEITEAERIAKEAIARDRGVQAQDPYTHRGSFFVNIDPEHYPPQKIRRYNLVVLSKEIVYNKSAGWHDLDGTMFVLEEDEDDIRAGRKQAEPLYIRANKGEVLEMKLTNKSPTWFDRNKTMPEKAFEYDFPQLLAECGLHVHLVKFDPLVSDGASTGWNYLSGAAPGESMYYRWRVDEEFGVIFFHDHLFANFRQKRGLFGAAIAEPEGAQYLDPNDPSKPLRSGSSAVIKLKDGTAFREFCVGIMDFIPMYDVKNTIDGKPQPLNPPENEPDDDPGTMGVNYRCEPLRERQGDPANWFSSLAHGDPETNIFRTYAGDRIRLRLIQGAHEEQHSFIVHGMRWHQWRYDPKSPIRNQQTIGLSEAFTFHVDRTYGAGDYLWLLGASDDLWLGCWGLIRAYDRLQADLPLLPGTTIPAIPALPTNKPIRKFHVVARQRNLQYRGLQLTDPKGLIFEVTKMVEPDGTVREIKPSQPGSEEPLILRCRAGEWIEVTLKNELAEKLSPEANAPELPVEPDTDRREISSRVSLHANLLQYDIRSSDGSNVGKNPDQTAKPGETKTYRWYADRELGVVYLQDMADFRNHRHHGLIGAIVVEPYDTVPCNPGTRIPKWHGAQAAIHRLGEKPIQELVLLMQDGLRLFDKRGLPVPDPDDDGELDKEDQGQKGFNYRSEPIDFARGMRVVNPATPIWQVNLGDRLWLRLVVAADKPRNHSFTVHGHVWAIEPQLGDESPVAGSLMALSTGSVHNLKFVASKPGDYAYRSGVLKWTLGQGAWGIIRVGRGFFPLRR
jgi:manganese oxidase